MRTRYFPAEPETGIFIQMRQDKLLRRKEPGLALMTVRGSVDSGGVEKGASTTDARKAALALVDVIEHGSGLRIAGDRPRMARALALDKVATANPKLSKNAVKDGLKLALAEGWVEMVDATHRGGQSGPAKDIRLTDKRPKKSASNLLLYTPDDSEF